MEQNTISSNISNGTMKTGSHEEMVKAKIETIREDSLRPTRVWGKSTKLFLGFLFCVAGWGLFAYVYQCIHGLGATAMRNYVSWGLYISTLYSLLV